MSYLEYSMAWSFSIKTDNWQLTSKVNLWFTQFMFGEDNACLSSRSEGLVFPSGLLGLGVNKRDPTGHWKKEACSVYTLLPCNSFVRCLCPYTLMDWKSSHTVTVQISLYHYKDFNIVRFPIWLCIPCTKIMILLITLQLLSTKMMLQGNR